MHTLSCAGCGESFEAKSSRAKWCTPACKKRHQRSGVKVSAAAATEAQAQPDEHEHDLVATTRRELEVAGRVQSFAGQLALQLAKRLASPDESGVSALSKELRTVMAAALDGVAPPPAEGSDEDPAEDEDDVTRARRRREEAREAAGLA